MVPKWMAVGLGVLSALLAGGLLWCLYRDHEPTHRPLPYFRGVKFFNGSGATQPKEVKEEHRYRGTSTWSSPMPTMPAKPDPNEAASYNPGGNMTNIEEVKVTITIPAANGGADSTITVTGLVANAAGTRIIEIDVILQDDAVANKVKAVARLLWYQANAAPYWHWDDSSTVTISGSPAPTPGGATAVTTGLPLDEISLMNSVNMTHTQAKLKYTSSGFGDYLTNPTTLGPGSALDWSGNVKDVIKAQAFLNSTTAAGTLDVNDTAKDHVNRAYFLATSANAASAYGIIQSTVLPYWYFK